MSNRFTVYTASAIAKIHEMRLAGAKGPEIASAIGTTTASHQLDGCGQRNLALRTIPISSPAASARIAVRLLQRDALMPRNNWQCHRVAVSVLCQTARGN